MTHDKWINAHNLKLREKQTKWSLLTTECVEGMGERATENDCPAFIYTMKAGNSIVVVGSEMFMIIMGEPRLQEEHEISKVKRKVMVRVVHLWWWRREGKERNWHRGGLLLWWGVDKKSQSPRLIALYTANYAAVGKYRKEMRLFWPAKTAAKEVRSSRNSFLLWRSPFLWRWKDWEL